MVHNGSQRLAMVNTPAEKSVVSALFVLFPIPPRNPLMRLTNLTHVSLYLFCSHPTDDYRSGWFVRIFRYPGSDIAIHILFMVDAMIGIYLTIPYSVVS